MLKLKENLIKLNINMKLKRNSNIIMRIEYEKNVVFTSVLFAKTEFLENIKNYYEGDIYVNSNEEENFLWFMNKDFFS